VFERLALAFYAVFAASSLIWVQLAQRDSVFWVVGPPNLRELVGSIVAGLGFGLAVVVWTRWSLRRVEWARTLGDWFASVLGPISWKQAFLLAAASSLGEEMLFRGAMQPTFGLGITTVLFALMHWPPRRELVTWTISAGVIGLAFGAATLYTGNIFAAIVAHFVINFMNLKAVTTPADEV